MARRLRIEFPGALYHVIVRGNNREKVFAGDEDKKKYLRTIEKYKEKYGFKLYAFALLDNHVHMLLEVAAEPLSKIMQSIQQVYTQFYNWKYERTGHVFQQRYNAKVCLKDSYLLTLINYIHHNPVKAGLSESPDYPWSSHKYYLQPYIKSIVDVDFPLSFFGSSAEERIKNYMRFMGQQITEEITYPSLEFVKKAKEQFEPDDTIDANQKTEAFIDSDNSEYQLTLGELQSIVADEAGIKQELITEKCRLPEVVLVRKIFIYIAVNCMKMKKTTTARFLNVSNSNVSLSINSIEAKNKARAELLFNRIKKEQGLQNNSQKI